MIDRDQDLLQDSLNRILDASKNINGILLIDKTGFVIADCSKESSTDKLIPVDILAAITSAAFSAIEEQGVCLNYGDVESLAVGFKSGFIFSTSISGAILNILTTRDINQKMVKYIVNKHIKDIIKTLSAYHFSVEDSEDIKNQLKSTLDLKN